MTNLTASTVLDSLFVSLCGSYIYAVEVQTQVHCLCYINRLEVLVKVL